MGMMGSTGPLEIKATMKSESEQNALNEKVVFVSYAWGGESERIVVELESAFAKRDIRIVRDKKDLKYKGSIQEFERRIGLGQCIILVISDKYLRSEHCMFELVEIAENKQFQDRIFPVVLASADIYKSIKQIQYIKYWEGQIKELKEGIKSVDPTNSQGIYAKLNLYDRIRAKFDHLTNLLSDMNALTPEFHATSGFSTLINAIQTTLDGKQSKSKPQPGANFQNAKFELLADKYSQRGKIQSPPQNESPSEDSLESRWLTSVGLKENPFRRQDADEKDPYLPIYFSRFTELKSVTMSDLMNHRIPWFFWGEKGSGKTTLMKFLAAQGRPAKNSANVICIEVDKNKVEQLISTVNDIDEFPIYFFRSLYERSLQYFPNEILGKNIFWKNQSDIQANLSNLSDLLKGHDIDGVLCLIDPSEESFTWKRSTISTVSLLELLLVFPQMGNIGFRYFLPVNVKDDLQKKYPSLLQNQRDFMQIEWDDDSLKKLIGNRMIAFSLEPLTLLCSVGQICDDEESLASLVDAEIASLAQGNPRAAIWLANLLIEVHCQNFAPTDRISPRDWDEVKSAWWSHGEDRILGISRQNKLRVLGTRIYFRRHEIVLAVCRRAKTAKELIHWKNDKEIQNT